MLAMVASGAGFAMLPKIVYENSHLQKEVKIIEGLINPPTVEAAIFVKDQKYIHPVKKAFWNHVSEVSSSLSNVEIVSSIGTVK